MLDLQSGGLEIKLQLNFLQRCMGFINWYHNALIYYQKIHPALIYYSLTNQPKLIVASGVHPSLHSNWHHQITYCRLILSSEYPPPYEHLVWEYNRANVEGIKKSIESVIWEVMLNNEIVHKQLSIFNETLMNMCSNFTPNKLAIFHDRDPLEWMIL